MVRPVSVLLVSLALLCAAGGVAVARPVCEADPVVTLAPEPPPPAPPPLRERTCIPGVTDDAGCWPESPAAPLPNFVTLGASDATIIVVASALPRPSAAAFRFAPFADQPLAPGHAPRLERPPRPFVV